MQKHLAYNTATGEVLTTKRANDLKRWVKRHDANDRKWFEKHGLPCPPSRWVFAHGNDYNDCIAKLMARQIISA